MIAPRTGIPLRLYITSTERSIGALLAQEKDGQERPVYYISRVVQGAEARYSLIERHYLFLAFVAKKFRHYFLAHAIHLITKCDPLRYLLSRPIISGRVARWLLIRVLGLLAALEAKIKRLHVQGDSNLVVKQLDGSYAIEEPALVAYRTIIQKLSGHFSELQITHAPRAANRHPDALATLASKVEITGESLKCGTGEVPLSELKNFALYFGVLYFRAPGGTLARCIREEEAGKVLDEIHSHTCDDNSLSLYRRIQRQGYYWPRMAKDAAAVQKACSDCREVFEGSHYVANVEED
ncbi:uncharacterized protein LOC132304667 [Cornus florida]|uniref:uncharacterized protein LOC132304667 n=1 Tax=Cornus florida TaxID=4283 RepID=UPI00289CD9C8|nr:uncharacterized protein LOC132304667 [Cornus florida]